jgi:DMSO/TMAO reductase YedYZ molybdopterin-dependent catalytic subunit
MAALSAAVGGPIVFGAAMPGGLIPAALAQEPRRTRRRKHQHTRAAASAVSRQGRNLVLLGDKPLAAETPEQLLDDETTPTSKFFISNNGQVPEATKEPDAWKLTIDGEVNKTLELTLGELKSKVRPVTRPHGARVRRQRPILFHPAGARQSVDQRWRRLRRVDGARLADVIRAAGLKPSAVFSGHYGADPHPSGDPTKSALSRGVPIKKLMDENNLIVWEMNGKPLEPIHGFPSTLDHPGWPGSVSAKWLTRIWLRDKPHDGQGMGGTSYRLAVKPMLPGSKVDEKNFTDLEVHAGACDHHQARPTAPGSGPAFAS